MASGSIMELLAKENLPSITLDFLKDENKNNLKLNSYEQITSHNNFYEFTTKSKCSKRYCTHLKTDNWKIKIDGLVENPMEIDLDDLKKMLILEERIYRFRCVEGGVWLFLGMVIPFQV